MNKKLTITLLGTLGVCVIGASSVFASTGSITGNSVRMRAKANTDSEIITRIEKGTQVEVESQEKDWYKITYNNKEGYIYKDYIDVEFEEETTLEEEKEVSQEETKVNTEKATLSNKLYSNSKVYLTACYSSSKIGEIQAGTKIKIEKTISNWSYVSNDDITGWIPNYKLMKIENSKEESKDETAKDNEVKTINKRAYLSTTAANLRKGPGTTYDTIGGIAENEVITVLSEEDGWYKVKTQDGTKGYVLKTLVTIGEKKVSNRSDTRDIEVIKPEKNKTKTETETKKKVAAKKDTTKKKTKKEEKKEENKKEKSDSAAETRKALVAYAKKYLGYKYVHGGASPKTGFDCSGFTSYVFGHFGYKLSRSSSAQASNGTHVNKSDLILGDLLIFTGHVGIYIGNGKFIHASNPSDGVKITKLSDSYYVKNYKDARRIIK